MFFSFKKIFFILFFIPTIALQAQIGGKKNLEFLNLPNNARLAGLGGINVSLAHGDVNSFLNNPALLEKDMHQTASFNYNPFYAGIKNTSLTYAHHFDKIGTFGASLQYLNYGSFDQTDETGNLQGTFTASDYAFNIAYQHTLQHYTLGITAKFIGSNIATYSAYALAFDIGARFKHPTQDFSIGLVVKNIGFPVKNYFQTKLLLPFDAQLGASIKPQHLPVRFSLTLHHLQKFDIAYDNPKDAAIVVDEQGNETREKKTFLDKFTRHFVIGTEIILHKSFQLRLGYNHLINRELKIADATGLAGCFAGFMFKVKYFEFGYTRGAYHLVGGRNFMTLSTSIASFKPKKVIKIE